MTDSPQNSYRVGDVVNGWRLAPDGTWVPASSPPPPQGPVQGVPTSAEAMAHDAGRAAAWPSGHDPSATAAPYGWTGQGAAPSPGGWVPPTKNTPATLSLTAGIVAALANLFFLPGIAAIVLGIVGLRRAGRSTPAVGRARSIWGIALALVGTVSGVLLLIAILDDSPEAASPDRSTVGTSPEGGSTQDVDLTSFTAVDAAAWAQIAKDPEAYVGDKIVLYAEVTQFDAATGSDSFRAGTGAEQPSSPFELDVNTLLSGDRSILADVTVGDVLKVHAIVEGATTYDTVMGGGMTAPVLEVAAVEDVGFKDLSGDVALGAPVAQEYGGVTLALTVTNSSTVQMTYSVEIVAESPDGTSQLGTASAYAENLGPGQSAAVTADFYEDLPPDAVFRIASVDRFDY
ncbi:DUF4190 domain-containing protein [Oerskovia jenensis]|uniref:DUF4190 domain-containing protein n=1 Tax=Oerskovia jenensis TaxID=162169 RepID=A0ABS2LDU0_9CELL|nr:DUF4190 domain-containing protein [Oerskovia jenensis]MBM7478278.1 hypothetical protein [Oerskovia jenensis]